MTNHRHMVKRVMKPEWKTDDEQIGAYLGLQFRFGYILGSECGECGRVGQGGAVDLDHGHVYRTGTILTLAPNGRPATVQQNGEARRPREVYRIGVQFDLDPVRSVPGRLVDEYMPARYEKQAAIALEKESGRICEVVIACVCTNRSDG
jgi:hypothetical protein